MKRKYVWCRLQQSCYHGEVEEEEGEFEKEYQNQKELTAYLQISQYPTDITQLLLVILLVLTEFWH